MVCCHFHLLGSSFPLHNRRVSEPCRPFTPSNRCSGAGYNWDSNAENLRTRRSKFNPNKFVTGNVDYGYGYEPRSGRKEKKRIWWYDDSSVYEDDDNISGDLGVSVDTSWIFKILRGFGWMVPAIVISMLLGTRSDSFIMALALPLGQSVLSLVIDKLWRSHGKSKPRRKTKKKPFSISANNISRNEKEKENGIEKEKKNLENIKNSKYTSSGAKDGGLLYGGWDELENYTTFSIYPKMGSVFDDENNHRRHKRRSKVGRSWNRDEPLVMKLIVAMFPFLGSWTELL